MALPKVATLPIPVMLTLVASIEDQLISADSPTQIVLGEAVMLTDAISIASALFVLINSPPRTRLSMLSVATALKPFINVFFI